ncbi:hypothetical protein [Haloarcula laminariae]|uniref:hypothetical protein n=1 Tax=Haloarcula laminariae TaxID=2961577 RepID=UPI0021CA5B15|nr:hypothetical protein [Halomicroarcula laminariae]
MNRRQLLATLGAGIGGLAGCLSGTPGESTVTPVGTDTDGERTTSQTPTATPGDDTEGVSDIAVRKAVRYESLLGSGGVLAAEGRQYVVASVGTDGDSRETEYVFEADGQTWEAGLPTIAGGNTRSVADRDWPVVGFEVPSPLPASNPQIRSADDAWALGADATETLGEPGTRYDLDELTTPESVSQGETMTVGLDVTNVSDAPGRFLAAVYWPTDRIADDDESHVVDRRVPAGDTITASLDINTAFTADESGPVTLSVEGHASASREIRVENVDADN